MKHDVCMRNISMGRKMCRLLDGIENDKLHNLINHNTNISDPWSRTLEHNYFQTCWKLSESNTFNNYLCNISISQYNYKYVFVKIEKGVKCLISHK